MGHPIEQYQHIVNVLKAERECILRQDTEKCQRTAGHTCYGCDLCLPATEILSVYDLLIGGYEALLNAKEEEITYHVTPRDINDMKKLKEILEKTFGKDEGNGR